MREISLFHASNPTGDMSPADAVGVPFPPQTRADGEPERWYIAVVTHNTEKACGKRLHDLFTVDGRSILDFEVYVPSQRELRVWRNGRRKQIERILIPTYLFVRCTERVRKTLKQQAPFIKHFLKNRAGCPDEYGIYPFAYIPDAQMASLQRMVGDAETPVTIDSSRLHAGVKVRVKGGRLSGFEGNVLHEPDGRTTIVIYINFLGCAKVEMPLELLELVE